MVATAVNASGKREVLGIDIGTSEDGASWLSFLRGLVARGLSGVELVTSDAHEGLKAAIATVFGGASWQPCGVSPHPRGGLPHVLHEELADAGAEERRGAGGDDRAYDLPAALGR